MFYDMDKETFHTFFKKVRKELEYESINILTKLVTDLDSHLDLNLSKEAQEDLIISVNDDFWTGLKSKINRKRNNKGPGNLSGLARSTGKNELVLNEVLKDDNITIENNTGSINIGKDNSIITSTTIIKKSKKNY